MWFNRVVVVALLAMGAMGAAVAQAEPAKPRRFALLESHQIALACAAAMDVRGQRAMRDENSTSGERLTALQQYLFARQVWLRDAKVDDASLSRSTRSFAAQRAAEQSAQSSYCFDVAAAAVDAMPEHQVSRLRGEGYATAQAIWVRHHASARASGERVGAQTL